MKINRMMIWLILLIFMPVSRYPSFYIPPDPPAAAPIHWLALGASSNDIKIIRDSLNSWNVHFRAKIFIEVDKNQDWTIIETPFDINMNGTYVVGYTDMANKYIYLFNIWHTNTYIGAVNVVAHEAGHALGYYHINRFNCLMYGEAILLDEFQLKDWCL